MLLLTTLLRNLVLLLIAGMNLSCAAGESPFPHKRQEIESGGEPTVVRIVSFAIAEGSEAAWSSACRRLAAAATASDTDANWLIHRVDNRSYYLVTFGSLAEFRDPHSPIEGFARRDIGVLRDEFAQLRAVNYLVISDETWEQVADWSTTSDQNSLTHPGVDRRSYRVDSRHLAEVDSILTEMANLLKGEDYPFPTEGFRVGSGQEIVVHVISFFGARTDYYARGQPEEFLAARGKRLQWLRLEERLDAITRDRVRAESQFMPELSYDPWLMGQLPTSGG
jgi:hypothetical protein